MIGVFLQGVRIGSLLKFPHLKAPWVAYADGDARQSFRLRKEAIQWLTEQRNAANTFECGNANCGNVVTAPKGAQPTRCECGEESFRPIKDGED